VSTTDPQAGQALLELADDSDDEGEQPVDVQQAREIVREMYVHKRRPTLQEVEVLEDFIYGVRQMLGRLERAHDALAQIERWNEDDYSQEATVKSRMIARWALEKLRRALGKEDTHE